MSSYRRHNLRPDAPRGRRTLLIVTVFALFLVGIDVLTSGALRNVARPFVVPLVHYGEMGSAAILGADFWTSRETLITENKELREQLSRQSAMIASYDVLAEENDELRRMLNLQDGGQGITAPIISSFRSSPYGTFIVGAGMERGLEEGSVVLSEGGFVLGVITDVSQGSSVGQATFAPGTELDVAVGSTGFTLSGRGRGNSRAEVPRELPLSEGDVVLAAIYASRPVGVVGRIESASSSAFATVHVVFPLNLNDIHYVHILPPYRTP